MDNLTKFVSALGGRKFLLAFTTVLLIVFFIDVDAETKLDTLVWLVGLYGGSNVAQKVFVKE